MRPATLHERYADSMHPSLKRPGVQERLLQAGKKGFLDLTKCERLPLCGVASASDAVAEARPAGPVDNKGKAVQSQEGAASSTSSPGNVAPSISLPARLQDEEFDEDEFGSSGPNTPPGEARLDVGMPGRSEEGVTGWKKPASDSPDGQKKPRIGDELFLEPPEDVFLIKPKFKKRPEVNLKTLSDSKRKLFIHGSDGKEWKSMLDNKALKALEPVIAREIRLRKAHRIMECRFVRTFKDIEKHESGLTYVDEAGRIAKAKSRLAALGHGDPDLVEKLLSQKLSSPTVSSATIRLTFATIASMKWVLEMGGISTAFLNSDPIEGGEKTYCELPPGLLGVEPGSILEVVKPFYGFNDAPEAWRRKLMASLTSLGWDQSPIDPCLYALYDEPASKDVSQARRLIGLLVTHVDDLAMGGAGKKFQRAGDALRETSKFGSWDVGTGRFLGMLMRQTKDGSIVLGNPGYGREKLIPVKIPKSAQEDDPVSEDLISEVRARGDMLQWAACQWRPDISAQTNLVMQAFPKPCVKNARRLNETIRRAKQDIDMDIIIPSLPLEELMIFGHSDSSLANARRGGTHSGLIVSVGQRQIAEGQTGAWGPLYWRSQRLRRAVTSTLSAEALAVLNAARELEWSQVLLAAIITGLRDVAAIRKVAPSTIPTTLVSDCKSLYDILHAATATRASVDREVSLDVLVLREILERIQGSERWAPGIRQLADGLTKDKAEGMDTLRATRLHQYILGSEDTALKERHAEKERRLQRNRDRQEKAKQKTSSSSSPNPSSSSSNSSDPVGLDQVEVQNEW